MEAIKIDKNVCKNCNIKTECNKDGFCSIECQVKYKFKTTVSKQYGYKNE